MKSKAHSPKAVQCPALTVRVLILSTRFLMYCFLKYLIVYTVSSPREIKWPPADFLLQLATNNSYTQLRHIWTCYQMERQVSNPMYSWSLEFCSEGASFLPSRTSKPSKQGKEKRNRLKSTLSLQKLQCKWLPKNLKN